jgi:hypothetical protein
MNTVDSSAAAAFSRIESRWWRAFGWVWRGAAGSPVRSQVRVLSRAALTPAHSIHVIETGGERLVIGCHAGGMRILQRSPEAE